MSPDTPTNAQTDARIRTIKCKKQRNEQKPNAETCGVVHGDIIQTARIIAGTDITIKPNTVIQLGTTTTPTPVTYHTETPIETTHPKDTHNVFIAGTHNLTTEHSNTRTTGLKAHAVFQAQQNTTTDNIFTDIPADTHTHTRRNTTHHATTWTVDIGHVNEVLREIAAHEYNITTTHQTITELFTPHPTRTLTDGPIITFTDTMIDPDSIYADCNPEDIHAEHTQHTPLTDKEYFEKHGECPADGCSSEPDSIQALHGHVGAKAELEATNGPHHAVNIN